MKKFTKICLIALCSGLLLTGIGYALGGNTFMYVDANGIHTVGRREEPATNTIEKHTLDPFQNLHITSSSISVELIQADFYGIEIKSKHSTVTHLLQDGTLTVKQSRNAWFQLGFSRKNEDYIKIFLPQNSAIPLKTVFIQGSSSKIYVNDLVCDELTLNLSSGKIVVEKLQSKTLQVKVSSGMCNFQNIKSDSITATLSSGTVEMIAVQTKSLDASISSGTLKLDGTFGGNSNLLVKSGSITMKIDGNEADYNHNLQISSGNIYINGIKKSNEIKQIGAEKNLDLKVSSGKISIDFLS